MFPVPSRSGLDPDKAATDKPGTALDGSVAATLLAFVPVDFMFLLNVLHSRSSSLQSAAATLLAFVPGDFIVLLNDLCSRSSSLQSKHLHEDNFRKFGRTSEAVQALRMNPTRFAQALCDPKC